jgi:hypothetical protein
MITPERIKPRAQRVVLERLTEEKPALSEGGLHLIHSDPDPFPYLDREFSRVVAVGPEVSKEVSVGMLVQLDKLCGVKVLPACPKGSHGSIWMAEEKQIIVTKEEEEGSKG